MSIITSAANIHTPNEFGFEEFTSPILAVEKLQQIYSRNIDFLKSYFSKLAKDGADGRKYRAFYPEIRVKVDSFIRTDSRLSFVQISTPGTYKIMITRPDLFANYLIQKIGLLLKNYKIAITISISITPIQIHLAISNDADASLLDGSKVNFVLRDVFDVSNLSNTNDNIVDGNVKEQT